VFGLRNLFVYIIRLKEVWRGRGDKLRSGPIGRVSRKMAVIKVAVLG
jgi:hypothetical protein